MMSSVPAYNDYAERVLMPEMDQAVLAEIKSLEAKGDTDNHRYMELGISPDATLARWDRTAELASIDVPALVIGARYDTMDPDQMEMMAGRLPRGRYLYCPNGSHLAMYDDQETYFAGLVEFLHEMARPRPELPRRARCSSRQWKRRSCWPSRQACAPPRLRCASGSAPGAMRRPALTSGSSSAWPAGRSGCSAWRA
jgi:hypothetical protein